MEGREPRYVRGGGSNLLQRALLDVPQLEGAAAGTEERVSVHSKGGDGVIVGRVQGAGGVLQGERAAEVVGELVDGAELMSGLDQGLSQNECSASHTCIHVHVRIRVYDLYT